MAYNDETGRDASWTSLEAGPTGALLVDLALAGRISLVDKKVTVENPALAHFRW